MVKYHFSTFVNISSIKQMDCNGQWVWFRLPSAVNQGVAELSPKPEITPLLAIQGGQTTPRALGLMSG